MKVIGINASPRKRANTQTLVEAVLDGAMEQVLIGNRQEMTRIYWEKLKHLVLGLYHQLNITWV
jgi:multimeric flavodoxin WrbA